ncbi:MAG: site-2 protease family protein [Candidatus Woesearchaeota archaeon]
MLDFLAEHKWTILFYAAVFLFVYINRSKFERQLKVIFIYRTKWGLPLMDSLAAKHGELIKILGYIGIGVGFVGMAVITFFLFKGAYDIFFVPNAPPTVSPVIPGVRVPGGLYIPFVQGIISIFIVAVVHEFFHGVVARSHNIPIKSSGPALIGPFFAAFVEPDEKRLEHQSDVAQYSVFAAGPFANVLLAVFVALILALVFSPVIGAIYHPEGISFDSLQPGYPAESSGMKPDEVYTMLDNYSLKTANDLAAALDSVKPNQTVMLASASSSYNMVATSHPQNSSKAYLGVIGLHTRFNNDTSSLFKSLQWLNGLFVWIFILSIGIGLANLMPIGPLDGGRMLKLAAEKIKGKEKGYRLWVNASIFFVFLILFLMTPIFIATLKAITGVS